MNSLRFLRVPFGGGAGGIRLRPAAASSAAAGNNISPGVVERASTADDALRLLQANRSSSRSSSSSSSRCLSTSVKTKHKDIPRRIYQSAPKRGHGRHSGMKKWSTAKGAPAPVAPPTGNGEEEEQGEGAQEVVALEKIEGSKRRAAEGGLREVSTRLKEIRVSPWSLNLLAKLVRGLPVVEASAQLQFCKKKHTTTVSKAIQNALNLADMRYGLSAEEMEVGEIFVTKGKVVKRIRIMGRGRAGIARRKWSHLNVTLKEVDFDEQIKAEPSRYRREKLQARKDNVEQLKADRGEQVYAETV
ncbi:unnamed protein product [Pylaiella littoralis]